MRVLVVAHGFPPYGQGGAEIYAEQHARMLVHLHGDDVHVLTRESRADRPEYGVRTEQRDGLAITWVNNTFRQARSYEDSYRNPAIAQIAARLMDQFQPHVAHVHHLTCLSTEIPELLRARRVPVFLTLHDYWLLCHRGQLLDTSYHACAGPEPSGCRRCLGLASLWTGPGSMPVLRDLESRLPRSVAVASRKLAASVLRAADRRDDPEARRRLEHMRRVCGHVTRFLAPSRSTRDRFLAFGIPPDRIELSEYGLDERAFSRPVSRPSHPPLRIGFLGSLMISKAPHVLLEAFQRLPPGTATLDVVGGHADYHGDSSYRNVLGPLLSIPGVRAHGAQSRASVAELLASLHVLVVPSIWPETSTFVSREALITGVPVIGSNIGGIPEIVQHERNGLLFEPGDVEGLHEALNRLCEDEGLLDRLRTGAAETSIRSLAEDVGATRRLYEAHLPKVGTTAATADLKVGTTAATADLKVGTTAATADPKVGTTAATADLKVGTTAATADLKVGTTTATADLKVGTTREADGWRIRSADLQVSLRTADLKVGTTREVVSVVLNYRTPADTSIAVASLKASDRAPEVIVVDNDSGVACRDALARWSGAVTHLQTGSNLGFAGGMNAGIRHALALGAQRVLLVNSDVVVPPDCLGRLEAALREQSDVGIVGPVLRSRAFPELVASAGIDYNLRTGRMRHRGAAASGSAGTMDGDVAAVSGCVMLVAREVFERVGLFDERYFFGFEDIDFCLRARAAGFRTRVAAGAVAYHEGGATIGAQSPRRLYFAARNHLMLAHAHAGGAGPMIRAARAVFIMSLNLAYAVKAPGGSLPVRVGAALSGIRDYFRGLHGADAVDP